MRSTETRPADVIELKDSLLGVYVVVKTRNLEANKASQVLVFCLTQTIISLFSGIVVD